MSSAQPVTFGQVLKRYRLAARLSQEALALRAGLAVRSISDLERDVRRLPHPDTIQRIADALRLSPQDRVTLASTARRGGSLAPPSAMKERGSALTPFIGRVRVLELLDRYLAGQEPPVLLFGGEPGIGKTRLLREAAARAQAAGWRVLSGGCTRRSAQASYAPFTSALAHAIARTPHTQVRRDLQGCAWLGLLLPELAERTLAPALSWKLPPEQEQRLLYASVGRYLANMAGPSGTLVILDDLQWAGGDALELLESLIRVSAAAPQEDAEVPAAPLRILGAYRDTEIHPNDALSLLFADLARDGLATQRSVSALDDQEAHVFADLLLARLYDEDQRQSEKGSEQGDERPPHPPLNHRELVEQIVQRAGGVPYFLVSYVLGSRIAGVEEESDGSPAAHITTPHIPSEQAPWQVTTSIRQRVAALPSDAQLLLGALAVVGRAASFALLAVMLARPKRSMVRAVEAACHARLLEEAHEEESSLAAYQFPHDLIREAVLHDLSAARRAVLHRAAGDAIETLDFHERRPVELAYHFAQAAEFARALPYALLAGNQAGAVYAFGEAEKHYRMALALAREVGDQAKEARALEQLAQTLVRQERNEEALEVVEQGLQLNAILHDHEAQARLAQVIADVHTSRGTPAAGVVRLQALMATLSTVELSAHGQARLHLALGDALIWNAQFATGPATVTSARAALEAEQRALAAAQRTGDSVLRLEILHPYGLAHDILGHQDESTRVWEEMIPLAEATGRVDQLFAALLSVGYSNLYQGRFATCRAYFGRALALSAEHDWLSRSWLHGNYGELEYLCGDWAQAQAHIDYAATAHGVRDPDHATFAARIWRGLLLVLQGDEEHAASALMEPLLWAERHHHLEVLRMAHGILAERDLLAGRFAEARARLEPLWDQDGAQGGDLRFIGPQLAWAYLEMGDVVRASATNAEVRACVHEGQTPPFLPDALRVSALIAARTGNGREARDVLDEALTLSRALPTPYAEAKVLWVYGRLEMAQGDSAAARERCMTALAICAKLGERLYAEQIECDIADL